MLSKEFGCACSIKSASSPSSTVDSFSDGSSMGESMMISDEMLRDVCVLMKKIVCDPDVSPALVAALIRVARSSASTHSRMATHNTTTTGIPRLFTTASKEGAEKIISSEVM